MLKESCLEVCKYIIRFDGYFPSLYCHPSFIFVYAVKMRRKRRQLSSFHFFFLFHRFCGNAGVQFSIEFGKEMAIGIKYLLCKRREGGRRRIDFY